MLREKFACRARWFKGDHVEMKLCTRTVNGAYFKVTIVHFVARWQMLLAGHVSNQFYYVPGLKTRQIDLKMKPFAALSLCLLLSPHECVQPLPKRQLSRPFPLRRPTIIIRCRLRR